MNHMGSTHSLKTVSLFSMREENIDLHITHQERQQGKRERKGLYKVRLSKPRVNKTYWLTCVCVCVSELSLGFPVSVHWPLDWLRHNIYFMS